MHPHLPDPVQTGDPTVDPLPPKAIPATRDRLQSRLLVAASGTALGLLTLITLVPERAVESAPSIPFILSVLLISTVFAILVRLLRAATTGGALAGGSVCFLLTSWSAPIHATPSEILETALTPLILLFVSTFLATRAGRSRKTSAGLAESRRGRSASQVLANLAAAALVCAAFGIAAGLAPAPPPIRLAGAVLSLAALAEATADTVSSELGQAFGGRPRMLLNLRSVPAGTDGAITALGSVAGSLSAIVIAFAGMGAMHLGPAQAAAAAAGGILGLFADSLLGATVERRGWLGNDLVNASSTLIAVLVAACLLSFGNR